MINTKQTCLLFSLAALLASPAYSAEFQTRVIATGLARPIGIIAGPDEEIYFTEVPHPGMPNAGNAVKVLDLEDHTITTLHEGEPEPVNLALDRWGNLYWTCKSAGVILERDEEDGQTAPLLTGLQKPSGIAVDRWGNIFYTLLPTPGVPGTAGGSNSVVVFDGHANHVLHMGEPEPQDITVSRRGELYWTCKSAGVILEQDDGNTSVLLQGLNKPVGIALNRKGDRLYWTEVPTPGVSGANGGQNRVWELNLRTMRRTLVHFGDPEPTDITVGRDGTVYWTCTSAGVIVEASRGR